MTFYDNVVDNVDIAEQNTSVEKRKKYLVLLSDGKERLDERRKKLVGKLQGGKSDIVFGNGLCNMPKYFPSLDDVSENNSFGYSIEYGLPLFVVRCIKKIETMIKTDGLYRVNGHCDYVQQLRYESLSYYLLRRSYYFNA